MEGQRCENCRFFKVNTANPSWTGSCRRYPPQVVYEDDSGTEYYFPMVSASRWCGEWRPANPDTVEQGAATLALAVLHGDMTAARALADKLTGNE